jgi:hypothetical protein
VALKFHVVRFSWPGRFGLRGKLLATVAGKSSDQVNAPPIDADHLLL